MYMRMATITGDPVKVDEVVNNIGESVGPAAEAHPGHRGGALFIDKDRGVTVGATYWDSAEAMESSGRALKAARDEAASVGGGSLTVEEYEVLFATRRSVPPAGGGVRMTRMVIDAGQIDAAMDFYHRVALPDLEAQEGLCSAQVLFDRAAGRAIAVSAWRDRAALDAGRARAVGIREEGAAKLPMTVQAVEEYTMVSTTVRFE
jgi:heme-degrading monooxygenase HmoA